MNRLKKRLQVYGLVSSALIITLWLLLVPAATTKTLGTSSKSSQPPITPSSEVANLQELKWLSKLFKQADTTADGVLSPNELTWAVQNKISKHVREALMSNPRNFFSLDKINHNGQVEWEEWLTRFYKDHNIEKDADMQRGHREKLAAAKAAWSEAARSNPDALNLDEFLGFTHPESSHSGLSQQLEEMLIRHDLNGDGVIALQEYLDDPFYLELTSEEQAMRKREFLDQIDGDNNGSADRREILTFLDPKGQSQAKAESNHLITLADEDGDGFLSFSEVKRHAQTFLDSKWVSPERSFHWDL